MPFSEAVKLEAKERAHYACIWCQETKDFIVLHHILPQEEKGPDTLDNTAPLCSACHALIGGNPDLRKQMREKRDSWWKRCANLRGPAPDPEAERLRNAQERCERAVRVCLNMDGVSVNYVGVGEDALEVHFTHGHHQGGTVLRYQPTELLVQPAEVGQSATVLRNVVFLERFAACRNAFC